MVIGSSEKKIDVELSDNQRNVTTKEAPKIVVPKAVAKVQKIDTALGECADGINSVVRRYLPQIKQCHEARLKTNPKVAGRLVVDVDIEDGVVTSVRAGKNTTGDVALAKCIERKVRRWKFPEECTDLASLPFLLSPQK